MTARRTIAAPVTIVGPALFSGVDSTLTLSPASPGQGLCFRTPRGTTPITIDRLSNAPAHPVFSGQRPRCTSVNTSDRPIAMIEHAMAALAGLGITDAVLECPVSELPIRDGSAIDLTRAILAAGITDLGTRTEPITLREPVEYTDRDATITAEPSDSIDYAYRLDYGPGSPIPPATARWLGDADDFAASIAPARTFSTAREAEHARQAGLFARFTPADLLVIDDTGPIDNALRFPDECARHKLLDLIGDLALLGRPLQARVRAHKSGHADTHALCRLILAAQ